LQEGPREIHRSWTTCGKPRAEFAPVARGSRRKLDLLHVTFKGSVMRQSRKDRTKTQKGGPATVRWDRPLHADGTTSGEHFPARAATRLAFSSSLYVTEVIGTDGESFRPAWVNRPPFRQTLVGALDETPAVPPERTARRCCVLSRARTFQVRALPASLPRNDQRPPATSDVPPSPPRGSRSRARTAGAAWRPRG
jgi:hypothetical protein